MYTKCRMKTLAILLLLSAIALFVIVCSRVQEPFGTSPGTLVQLASSHVPTEEDSMYWAQYAQQVNKDLKDMTGEPLV
jgi:hypothetical protein